MENGTDFLTIYAEIVLGSVAFMAIVATLRQTLGEPLTEYQYLITRYFVDIGLLHVIQALFAIALFSTIPDTDRVWEIVLYSLFFVGVCYFIYYMRRRFSIKAPKSLPSIFVIVGYLIAIVTLGVAAYDPSLWDYQILITFYFCWVYFSLVVIFLVFMGSFINIHIGEEKS